jgi:hypothetical protein
MSAFTLSRLAPAVSTALLLSLCASVTAQTPTQGIFTCTDAQGRKLTADRPIPACSDREQKLLNPSGTVKTRIGPTLTQQQRVEMEAKKKLADDEQERLNEEKRRERALLIRYPTQGVHDKERAAALAQIGVSRQAAMTRTQELVRQRSKIDKEMEFYANDPAKAPPALRLQMDDTVKSLAAQIRYIADQDNESKRVNTRFDDELIRLKPLWVPHTNQRPAALSPTR